MNEILIRHVIFTAFFSLSLLGIITKWLSKSRGNRNLPPSPPELPILGNLHQVGSLHHQSLHSMAKKYGQFMLLQFGSVPVLIASSAEAAREVMRTHDVAFADRPVFGLLKKLVYDGKDIAFSPYGEYWRKVKSMLVLQVMNSRKVRTFRWIREKETALLIKRIRDHSSSGRVNLTKMFFELSNNGICQSAFGRKYDELVEGKKFFLLMEEIVEVAGIFHIGDYVPWLSWMSRLSGLDKRVDRIARELDDLLESVIEERIRSREEGSSQHENGDNFLDIMLDIYNRGDADLSIDRDTIKALMLDVFGGGTDTTAVVLEWAMAELLRHPTEMEKLQSEVREIVKQKHDISDDDLEKMHYLKAVIKETIRLHPPLPLLLPRVARKDVQLNGYDISSGTMVLVNAWAIGRDHKSWDEPERFKPERFLNSSIDFKGMDFGLIPFGAGRRICPGITYSAAIMELVLANLVQKFNWKLPDGAEGKDMCWNVCI